MAWVSAASATVSSSRIGTSHTRNSIVSKKGCGRTSHQIFFPLSMQFVLTRIRTYSSKSAGDSKTSGMLVRGNLSKTFVRFPRTNIPEVFESPADFDEYVRILVKTNCIDNGKKIWWDVRPHPFFETI